MLAPARPFRYIAPLRSGCGRLTPFGVMPDGPAVGGTEAATGLPPQPFRSQNRDLKAWLFTSIS